MINNEEEFLKFAKLRVEFDELILRAKTDDRFPPVSEKVLDIFRCTLEEIETEMHVYESRANPVRVGIWMPMPSGRRFWPQDPRPQDFNIDDIAYGLSRLNRFNGKTKQTYSVAQHSVYVSRVLEGHGRGIMLFGLLHDAAEAYLGDVITPVKNLFREQYDAIEDKVMSAIAKQFHFYPEYVHQGCKAAVKKADVILLATEARDVATVGFVSQRLTELPLDTRIDECWSPEVAKEAFLAEFEHLNG